MSDAANPNPPVNSTTTKVSPESSTTPSTQVSSTKDNLPAWLINTDNIKDKEQQKEAETQIKAWVERIQKDVSEILEKNGVKTFQLTILHQGSGTPIPLGKGTNYNCGRLAVYACRMFKARIDQEFAINDN